MGSNRRLSGERITGRKRVLFARYLRGLKCRIASAWKALYKPADGESLQQNLQKVDARLLGLEQGQRHLVQLLQQKCWVIEKVVVEKIQTDRVEFRLDSIDVKDLRGTLNIGVNQRGRLVKGQESCDRRALQACPPKLHGS